MCLYRIHHMRVKVVHTVECPADVLNLDTTILESLEGLGNAAKI